MNSIPKTIALLQIVIMFFAIIIPASADTPAPPRDYIKETENGKYVFVMLAPPERWSQKDPAIRKTYKESGLYSNDGSSKPLWTVYWYSFEVYPSSDGKHIVRMGPWASSTDQLALAFYENGKDLKQYFIKDLVRDELKLRYTVSHFFWKSDLKFNDKEDTISLKTTDGQSYLFSVKTGEIIKDRR